MPPKKVIKLLEKSEKTEKTDKPEKIEVPIVVNADDVDNPAEEIKIKNKKNIITTKKTITNPIILTQSSQNPEPIIKDETELNLEDLKVEEKLETKSKDIKEKDIKMSKPIKSNKNVEINIEETENKSKQQVSKPKKNTSIKKIESSFDMFGDDKDDYREILLNYDYTKNKTIPKITKYERALLVGKRAKQIEDGANPNIKVKPGQSAIEIAEEELRQRLIPLILKRPNGNTFEYWKPADMELFMD